MWGTIVFVSLFAVLCARLFGARRRQMFDEAAALPLADDDPVARRGEP
jgi:cbb3-type cytochrome oxidase subunit 3